MVNIKQNWKATHDKKNIYANKYIVPRYLKAGEHVYLKIRPKKSSLKLGIFPKSEVIYYGAFEIIV